MILFWGLKKFPLRREIPALKDHLSGDDNSGGQANDEDEECRSLEVFLLCCFARFTER